MNIDNTIEQESDQEHEPAETVSFWGSCAEFLGYVVIGLLGGASS